jgi:hypothetical protein
MGGSGMGDNYEANPQDDEIILCVRYTTIAGWFIGIGATALGSVLGYSASALLLRGKYLPGLLVLPGCAVMVVVALDFFLTKHILFCRDRIIKDWYFLGQRIIPYARATLLVNPRFMRQWPGWRSAAKALRVKETDAKGRTPVLQVPILYCFLCVPTETRRKVEAVASYLVGIEDTATLYERSRMLVRTNLPKEVVCQN